MNSSLLSSLIALVGGIFIAGCVTSSSPTGTGSTDHEVLSFSDPNKMLIVDCMLPGRVHRLGTQATFISPRQPRKMAAGLCEIRGGEYVAYDRADLRTSLQVWLVAAETGSEDAQTYVGEMYENGFGMTPDYKKAAEWYRKAAEQGFARAQMNLGHLYEKGLGVPLDKTAALNWYRNATGLSQDELEFASQAIPIREELVKHKEYNITLENRLNTTEKQLLMSKRELKNLQNEELVRKAAAVKNETFPGSQQAPISELKKEFKLREQALESRQADIEKERDQFIKRAKTAEHKYIEIQNELEVAKKREIELTIELEKQIQKAKLFQEQLNQLQHQFVEKQQGVENARVKLAQSQAELAQRVQQQNSLDNEKEIIRLTELVQIQEVQMEQLNLDFADFSREVDLQRSALLDQLEVVKNEEANLRDRLEKSLIAMTKQRQQLESTEGALQVAQLNIESQGQVLDNLNQQLALVEAKALEEQNKFKEYVRKTGDKERADDLESMRLNQEIVTLNQQIKELKSKLAVNENVKGYPIPGDLLAPEEFGNYYALIIANSLYTQLESLPTAKEDARAVSKILEKSYGFKTEVLEDADLGKLLAELSYLRKKLEKNDKLLIYYIGHGYLDKAGNGWWQLVGASPGKTEKRNWLDDKQIAEQLDLFQARHILIVADSCYSTRQTTRSSIQVGKPPDEYGDRRTLKRWLKQMLRIESRMVLTSGGVKPVVSSTDSESSVFTKAFLNVLQKKRPVLEGSRLAYEIYQSIGTSGNQAGRKGTPKYVSIHPSSHRGGEFFFRRTSSSFGSLQSSSSPLPIKESQPFKHAYVRGGQGSSLVAIGMLQ